MPLIGEFFVNLQRGVVESEFDDGQVGCHCLEKIAEAKLGELEFGPIESGKGFAEVDEHEVALVSDEGEEGGLSGGIFFHDNKRVGGFLRDGGAFGGGQGAPGGPSASASSGVERCSLRW